MKTAVALVIALVTLAPHSAHAVPLMITEGTFTLHSTDWPPETKFSGANFSVFATNEPGSTVPPEAAFGVEHFSSHMEFLWSPSDVEAPGFLCGGGIGGSADTCGRIDLTSPGFAVPPDWPRDTPFVATVPFTATGLLCFHDFDAPSPPYCNAGEPQFDIVGHGTVTGTLCLDVPLAECGLRVNGGFEPARLVYRFTVAEPPTLSLLMLALVTTVVGLAFVHRRAAVNT